VNTFGISVKNERKRERSVSIIDLPPAIQKRHIACPKLPIACQKRPRTCQKQPIACQRAVYCGIACQSGFFVESGLLPVESAYCLSCRLTVKSGLYTV
jgi:hypothetical protein